MSQIPKEVSKSMNELSEDGGCTGVVTGQREAEDETQGNSNQMIMVTGERQ